MKRITIHPHSGLLMKSNEDLGALIRKWMEEEIAAGEARAEAAKDSARKKMGHPITIDGHTFLSRAQARAALGMSFAAFAKKYPNEK